MTLITYGGGKKTGKRKYTGEVASGYNEKRDKSVKWHEEDQIIKTMLAYWENCGYLLDIPCGTGRFFEFYQEISLTVKAADVSMDMLKESAKAIPDDTAEASSIELDIADITDLPYADDTFDVALMCRLTRWLDKEERVKALHELQRVSLAQIIFTARIDPKHPYTYPQEEIEAAIVGKWRIKEQVQLPSDPKYHIIKLEYAG